MANLLFHLSDIKFNPFGEQIDLKKEDTVNFISVMPMWLVLIHFYVR